MYQVEAYILEQGLQTCAKLKHIYILEQGLQTCAKLKHIYLSKVYKHVPS